MKAQENKDYTKKKRKKERKRKNRSDEWTNESEQFEHCSEATYRKNTYLDPIFDMDILFLSMNLPMSPFGVVSNS